MELSPVTTRCCFGFFCAVPDGEGRGDLGAAAAAAQLSGLPLCGSDTLALGKYEKCMSSC